MYDEYKKEMEKAIERMQELCKRCRDDSFALDLGEKNKTSQMKEKLQELSVKDTNFIYKEKNLEELLFAKEE